MTAQHTPGPWHTEYQEGNAGGYYGEHYIFDVYDRELASVHNPGPDESEANARLIAAAPTLLEALRAVIESITEYGERAPEWGPNSYIAQVNTSLELARAAIRLAEDDL